MINNDNENSTDTVTTKSTTISSYENNSSMSPTVSLSNPTGEEQPVQQNTDNDQNNGAIEKESQDNQLAIIQNEQEEDGQEQQGEGEDDEFIRITAAHQMLTEAQTYDEQKNFPAALHLYRICVDLLLEELMFTEGTDQSRVYLREKCTAIMDRIDLLKTMLEPIPPAPLEAITEATTTTTTTLDEQTTNPPTNELNSLHLS
ncbi:unnamed protein product [Adineta steineri]|uniref:MIT domain-containing protein n=1 Tax=Adineta steineri TaxID=433720 RepID=A0A818ZNB2_9BILA|nr:unnamed protein product [Adineta steineri]CAF3771995.1 unnamed protein product [Adineta steineri]